MKHILKVIIAVAGLTSSAFAGQLVDSANIFGPRSGEVAGVLASLPVSVETRVNTPAEGLKNYADAKAERNNFYVVITTQPRGWRISMNPVGLASSESVRLAGDRMTVKFRQGDFAGGVENLARELEKLTHPVSVIHYAPTAAVIPDSSAMEEGTKWFLWIMGGVLAFIVVCCLTVWFIERRKKKKEEEQKIANSINAARAKKPTKTEQAAAQAMYDSYTPAQRERVSVQYGNHPYYHSSILTDPFMFYWFMTTVNQPHYGYVNPGYGYAPTSPNYNVQSDPAPSSGSSWFSSPSSSSSSSDSSGASSSSSSSYSGGSSSSSYDSGSSSSSYDSGSSSSSSDSSGGGGSW